MGTSLDTIVATDSPAVAVSLTGPSLGRRRFVDRLARGIVTAGGLAIIASIAGILLFIVLEVWPLLRPASVTPETRIDAPSAVRAIVVDEYRSHTAALSADGVVRVWKQDSGAVVAEKRLLEGATVFARTADGQGLVAAAGSKIALASVSFVSQWADGKRTIVPAIGEPVLFESGSAVRALAARLNGPGAVVAAALESGGIAVLVREAEVNELTGETRIAESRIDVASPAPVDHLLLDESREHLFAAAGAQLLWWEGLDGPPKSTGTGTAITALGFLLGERSLLVGDERGNVSVWFPVRSKGNDFDLREVRQFPGEAPVRSLAASPRDKGFFALEEGGRVRLHHSTSERTLWTGVPSRDASAIAFAPKADGAVLAGPEGSVPLAVRNPHPDVSLGALFGATWYEGYEKPEYVWQSTGGTDDFETKLSLVPLLFGTVKGTLYSLLLAIPLAVFGAMYTSQFMHPRLRSWVKPLVELMAALPSVVLGFLAGLWLAPRVDDGFPALILAVLVVPLFVIGSGVAWTSVPRPVRQKFFVGTEVVVFAIAIVIGGWFCIQVAPWFETAVFHGTFRGWVTQTLGLGYDQRNAVVVGLAMGFAVIPIIFAISEDAFTNVPASLTSASLALGANRWQTVSRVVLPAASPGIFSAVMVGFGRAVGETMIVLMATGNTPIMEWNPFNGFRTLSANIAVEIPEAPHGGTLYRALFLAALLLFVMTFVVNTVAELVRQRLRRKYSEAA